MARKIITAPLPSSTTNKSGEEPPLRTDPSDSFPIVGIGASAGGLEALELFFRQVPAESGMAFVVISHLDPTRKGIMPELLQRVTSMSVIQAADNLKVAPDHVYVIPPNTDLSFMNGGLHLCAPEMAHGLRLPIDFFLRSLAADRQELAIGVILSGMGSDGTLGLRAIKEHAGLTLAQDPASAKFDGMPRSVIDAGVVDIIAPADQLPERIIGYLRHAPLATAGEPDTEARARSSLDKILLLLRVQTGHDFFLYKKSTLYRRIERRMSIHQIERISAYAHFMRENPAEVDLLFKELLIGVTNFFRDPAAWDILKNKALPELLAVTPPGRILRAWVVGCSTGEEAYSLAIVFKEALANCQLEGRFSLQIYATDLDHAAIEKARQGSYPANIAADVSPERLNRFFMANDHGYSVGKEIREMVIFAPQNVIMDPPFTRLDFLTCRNLLIYLGPELQKKLLPLFHYSLNVGGILMLGSAETIGSFTDLFAPIDNAVRLYQRTANLARAAEVQFPTKLYPGNALMAGDEPKTSPPITNLQVVADQLLLRSHAPAAVFFTAAGDIVYINGRTGKYLEPVPGRVNWNIFAMAHIGLRHELVNAVQRTQLQGGAVRIRNLRLEGSGAPLHIDLIVEAIAQPEALAGMFVAVFHDLPTPPRRRKEAPRDGSAADTAELEAEVQRLREQLQTIQEEMQSSQEELRSSNEELQSTNEELQSTNEELTTSREEMQSLNEELQTVNAELQSKVEDLSRSSNDMKNLLDSTDIAIVFLDNALHVRRFTNSTTRIIKLIQSDIGRPLSDIVSKLDYPSLREDSLEVLRTLVFSEKEVYGLDGRCFLVRIMPYRTTGNVIDGLVITFVDVSKAKSMEGQLREALNHQQT
jgi:two-component system CheB/CheR fusion protein